MQHQVAWTPEMDCRLLAHRASGASWESIAHSLHLGRYTVVERGRRLGARKEVRVPPYVRIEDHDRPARPAGHPDSWGLIIAGTLLQGTPYPFPVFL